MRLVYIDIFRGLAIATMILVNFVSLAPKPYSALDHSSWNGCTLADLVFPAFLFVVGLVLPYTLGKYLTFKQRINFQLYSKIIRRSLILFGLGLLLNGFYNYDLSNIRILGVLQRIALCYLFSSVLVLNLSLKQIKFLCASLLIFYYLALTYLALPGHVAGDLSPIGNLGSYIDRHILSGDHLYKGGGFHHQGDPEGLFSTIGALVTTLLGYLTGEWISRQKTNSQTSINLAIMGLASIVVGGIWNLFFPINKQLWTSSYVLHTAGWSLLALAICYQISQVRKKDNWGKPLEILGLNSLFIFICSVLEIKILVKTNIGEISTYQWLYEHLFLSWLNQENASLLLAILMLLFWSLVAYFLYKRRIFIKI